MAFQDSYMESLLMAKILESALQSDFDVITVPGH
jgi:hypothetical protein